MAIDRKEVQERAEKLVAQGKVPAAITVYRTLYKDQPNDLNTINRLGDLLVREKKNPEAIELFGRAAQLYSEGGFFLKAIAIYRKILKIDPGVIEPRLKLADLYSRRDLTTDARVEYMAVAEKLVRDGNTVRAKDVYERLIRVEPGNVQARIAMCDLLAAGGKPDKAVEELRKAAEDMEALGLDKEAAQVHRRILTTASAGMAAHSDAIRGLARLGCTQEALTAAQALKARSPDQKGTIETLVEPLELAGRHAEAEAIVRAEIPDDAVSPVVRMVLGRVRAEEGHLGAASSALLSSGRDLLAGGRPAEAVRAVDALLRIEPGNKDALELRLDAARTLGDADTANRISERLMVEFGEVHRTQAPERVPEPASAPRADVPKPSARTLSREDKEFLDEHLTEAEVFVKYGLLEKAIEPLKQVLVRFPDHLEAHQRLKTIFGEQGNRIRVVEHSLFIAEIYERTGRGEEARKVLAEAQNLDPDNPVVGAWLTRLDGRGDAPGPESPIASGPGQAADSDLGAMEESRIDLIGDFGETLADALRAEPQAEEPEEEQNVAAVFKAFRQKVDEEVSSDDFNTRYDLAIAYKEMGLIDEAISEFEFLSRDPLRFVECCAMLGLCYRQKGLPAQAERWYLAAIGSPAVDAQREMALRFELAETYLELGDYERAREGFRRVAGVDSTYRNVAARLQDVEKMA